MTQTMTILGITSFMLRNNNTPLRFEEYVSPLTSFKSKDVDKMVLRVLELTTKHASANIRTRKIETEARKRRSALDIWRHIIYYYPDVSIFSVMKSLYKLVNAEKVDQVICKAVGRRTFSSKNMYGNFPSTVTDEFGLEFEDWKDI